MSALPVRRQTKKCENDEDASTNIKYTCHICSIEVPAAFSEEHNASKKHRANASVVATASERMRALLTARPAPRARSAAKYCGVCNSIVENGHEKTAKHKQALRDDQLLCMLASMYCGEDGHDTDESEDHEDVDEDVVGEEIKDQDGSRKDRSAEVDDRKELASHERRNENEKQNEDDDHFVDDETVGKVNKGLAKAAFARMSQQVKRHREISTNRDELNAAAGGKVDEVSKDDKAMNDNSNANSRKDSHSGNTAQTKNIGGLDTAQPSTVAFKSGLTQNLRDRTENIQLNKGIQNSVDNGQINQPAEVKNAKSNIEKSDNVTDIKTDQRPKPDEIENQASGDGNLAHLYDPRHDYFWSLVKIFQMEQPWRHRYINIHPAGNKIQICINNEKLNVSYDNFHSFGREGKKIRCRVCSVYFDKEREDKHTASKQHMGRIMLAVNDSHCFRRITHWSHCILCNEILMTHFEMQHQTLFKHSNTIRLAAEAAGTKQGPAINIDPFNHMGPYDPSHPANRPPKEERKERLQDLKDPKLNHRLPVANNDPFYYTRSSDPGQDGQNPSETISEIVQEFQELVTDVDKESQRRKITLQKQLQQNASAGKKENGQPTPRPHFCLFQTGPEPYDTYCVVCGTQPTN